MMKGVKHWDRLTRKAVDSSSLETLRYRQDGALSNLMSLKTSLLIAWGVGLDDL